MIIRENRRGNRQSKAEHLEVQYRDTQAIISWINEHLSIRYVTVPTDEGSSLEYGPWKDSNYRSIQNRNPTATFSVSYAGACVVEDPDEDLPEIYS